MRFMSILLNEGRKEDLRAKYIKSMDPAVLDWILGISDLQDFNHKYTDFVLRTLTKGSEDLDMDVEVAIQLIKDFDKYQSQLDKKDINQYKSIIELENSLKPFKKKQIEKEEEKKVERIYEDDKYLVIRPQSQDSACKYGSNTRWCITQKSGGHYERYTSGRQAIYYVINKANSRDKNYSKVAIHFDNSGYKSYWDSQDEQMNVREVSVFNYAFPNIISAIDEDYKKKSVAEIDLYVNKIFDDYGFYREVKENIFGSDNTFEISVEGFERITDLGFGHAHGNLSIVLNSTLIDSYEVFITYRVVGDQLKSSFGFMGKDIEIDDLLDFGLEGAGFDQSNAVSEGFREIRKPNKIADSFRQNIVLFAMNKYQESKELQTRILGDKKTWTNLRGYGYTFKMGDKGLIKKLVNWLDAGKIGTKLDFLADIGKLEKQIVGGKSFYSRPNESNFLPSSKWRGQHSSFFASARHAEILDYRKVGQEYFLIKGSNFDAFKEGKLRAL